MSRIVISVRQVLARSPRSIVVAGPSLVAGTASGQALLNLAIESVFGNATGAVVDGDQTVFSRLRVRVDTVSPGNYTVTHSVRHSYGVLQFNGVGAGIRAIDFTCDPLVCELAP